MPDKKFDTSIVLLFMYSIYQAELFGYDWEWSGMHSALSTGESLLVQPLKWTTITLLYPFHLSHPSINDTHKALSWSTVKTQFYLIFQIISFESYFSVFRMAEICQQEKVEERDNSNNLWAGDNNMNTWYHGQWHRCWETSINIENLMIKIP